MNEENATIKEAIVAMEDCLTKLRDAKKEIEDQCRLIKMQQMMIDGFKLREKGGKDGS